MNRPWMGGLVKMSDVFQNIGYLLHGKVGGPQLCIDNSESAAA